MNVNVSKTEMNAFKTATEFCKPENAAASKKKEKENGKEVLSLDVKKLQTDDSKIDLGQPKGEPKVEVVQTLPGTPTKKTPE